MKALMVVCLVCMLVVPSLSVAQPRADTIGVILQTKAGTYTTGMVAGGFFKLTNFFRSDKPVAMIQSVVGSDSGNQTTNAKIYLFTTLPDTSLDSTLFTINDATAPFFAGYIQITSWVGTGTASVFTETPNLVVGRTKPSQDLFGYYVVDASAVMKVKGLRLRFTILRE